MKQTEEKTVIFVCTGNTCRSPMAEAIFRYEAKRRGLAVSVCSAGTEAAVGGGMHLHSLRTLASHGLSIENFSPTQLTLEMLKSAYAVVCMTERQKEVVAYNHARVCAPSETEKRVFAFADFCGYSIPDPYGCPIEEYERTYEALVGGMSAMIDKLFPKETVETPEKTEEKPKEKKPRKPRGEGAKKTAASGATKKTSANAGAKKSTGGRTKKSSASGGTTKKKSTGTRKSVPKKENENI